MPDTRERELLGDLITACEQCRVEFVSNVALIAEDGKLRDWQVPSVLALLRKRHEAHVEEHHVH